MKTANPLVKTATALLGAACLLVPSLSQAETLLINISSSNYIRSGNISGSQVDKVQGTGISQSALFGDIEPTTGNTNDDLRAIFSVDLNNPLLTGQTITNATLKLKISASDASSSSTETIQLFQLTETFAETQATWNSRVSDTPWTTPGGTFNSGSPLATLTANPSAATLGDQINLSSVSLASLVQNNIGGTLYFIVKLANEDNAARSIFRVGSDDNNTSAYRPQFELEYSAIPEPGTYAVLLGGMAGVLAFIRRRRQG